MAKESLTDRMANWMRGRNGADELGNAVLLLALILLIIDIFVRTVWLSVIALVLLAYSCWRVSSANVRQRRAENATFVNAIGPAARFLSFGMTTTTAAPQNPDYKYLECPTCGQTMRVPSGKGRMRVTCPRCQNKFETRS